MYSAVPHGDAEWWRYTAFCRLPKKNAKTTRNVFTGRLEPATREYKQCVSNCGTTVYSFCSEGNLVLLCVRLLTSRFATEIGHKRRPPGHEGRTAEGVPGRVDRGEQGVARAGNSAPRGGIQLEFFRRRLKTWSKSDPSASLVQTQHIF